MRYSSDKSACVAPSSTAKGCTQARPREVLFIIIERKHFAMLKKLVKDLDPKAFITTADASNDSMPLLP